MYLYWCERIESLCWLFSFFFSELVYVVPLCHCTVDYCPAMVSTVNYMIFSAEKREESQRRAKCYISEYKTKFLYNTYVRAFCTICKLSSCDSWQAHHMDMPVEVFNSPSILPKDPILRKQQLEDLMTKIHGSFSFMQVEFSCLQPRRLYLEINIYKKMCKMKLLYDLNMYSALPPLTVKKFEIVVSCSGLSFGWWELPN